MITGGYDGDSHDDILEFVPNKDVFSSVGQMIQARAWHAVSVVQTKDYIQWCQQSSSARLSPAVLTITLRVFKVYL